MDEHDRHCEALVRASDKDRFLASLFAPADRRGPLFALYAFDIEIARVRDRAREPMAGEIRLQWWRDVLNGERAGEAAANPVAAALTATIARFDLPVAPLLDVIEARAFTLYSDPMPTQAALEGYGRKSEGVIVRQAACITSRDDAALTPAGESVGIAVTITDVLRFVGRDASRQQIFLPCDLLERHGARIEDVYAGRATPALRDVLAELRAEARHWLAVCESQLPQMPASALPAFLILSLVPAYLAAMEQPGYEPFRSAAEVPQWRRQWAMWRAVRRWSRVMRG